MVYPLFQTSGDYCQKIGSFNWLHLKMVYDDTIRESGLNECISCCLEYNLLKYFGNGPLDLSCIGTGSDGISNIKFGIISL